MTSPGIQETKWLKNSDIAVTGVKEQFQSGKMIATNIVFYFCCDDLQSNQRIELH